MVAESTLKHWFWPILALVFVVLSIGLSIALIVVCRQRDDLQTGVAPVAAAAGEKIPVCGATNVNGNTINLTEPAVQTPFHDLTIQELKNLRKFVEEHPDIKAAKSSTAKVGSSYIYMMDLIVPPKAEVLKYMKGEDNAVSRSARVIMFRGDLTPPVVQEWKCGPLPIVFSCELLRTAEINERNPVEFSLRPFNAIEIDAIVQNPLKTLDSKISRLLLESYNATFTQCVNPKDCLTFAASPMGTALNGNINDRSMWLFALYNISYPMLHPLGFGVLLQVNGADPTKWTTSKVYYNGLVYDTAEKLMTDYDTTGFKKINITKPVESDKLFSSLQRRGDPQPANPQRPPTLVEPDGKRYSVQYRKVTYLNWSFHFRMSAYTGPALYDVRFKGERIAYEVALSEIAVFYSGHSPYPQTTNFVDSGSLLGTQSRALVPGADCPVTATLINQTFLNQNGEAPGVYDAAFCLFENNNGNPLRRHLSYSLNQGGFYGGMLDSALTLRSALTILNNDYIVDFIFHQNGVLETKLMATGYILSSFYKDVEAAYGFKIQNNIVGNIHHHMANFKVDLDIGGSTLNRFQTLDILAETVPRTDDPSKMITQNKINRTLKMTEKEAVIDYDFNKPKYYIVYNNASENALKEKKGFRIQIEGMSKSLLPEGDNNEVSIPWARHQMVVTKQKDAEIRASSNFGMWDSANPVANFTRFYDDNENIVDEDLVLWITCGTYHIPRSEDLPLTPAIGNHIGFYIMPFNYYDECPSMSSRDAIYIHHTDMKDPTKGVTVERYGNTVSQCTIPKLTLEADLAANPDQVLESKRVNLVN